MEKFIQQETLNMDNLVVYPNITVVEVVEEAVVT
jgi:hypothetical protein